MYLGALHSLLALPRAKKRALQVLADCLLLAFSYGGALALGFGHFGMLDQLPVWGAFLGALPVTLLVFVKLGFYRAVIRYMGLQAVSTILSGLALSGLVMGGIIRLWNVPVPITVVVIHLLIAFCTVGGVRFVFRALWLGAHRRDKRRVIIYGAGQSGRQMAQALLAGPDYTPVAFLDDNPEIHGMHVSGIRVFAPAELGRLIEEYHVQILLLAMPSATQAQRAQILHQLEVHPVQVRTLPDMWQVMRGRQRSDQLTEVPVEHLLGRDPVPPDPQLMGADIRGRVVMVTGGGGSIGSELCRQILQEHPAALIVLDHSEYALYRCETDLREMSVRLGVTARITAVLMSVLEEDTLAHLMRSQGVQTVYHTAAYKHVPLVEDNAVSGLRNNVFGTRACLRAADRAGAATFILISTDKAVRPANIMGASKRVAELVARGYALGGGRMRVAMVRFGNVLASSGSVVPLFRAQIAAGGPVTVTHPEVTRYFMTIPEAAQLVIQAGAMARGGETFLLDMGEPVRIIDLAERMIRLSGLRPQLCQHEDDCRSLPPGVVPIVITGLRRGEKLHEELLIGLRADPTRHPRIHRAEERALPAAELERLVSALEAGCARRDVSALRRALEGAQIGFSPRPILRRSEGGAGLSAELVPLRAATGRRTDLRAAAPP